MSDKTLEWEMIHEWGFLDPNMADTATEYVRSKIAEAVAAERERCAKVVDKHAELGYNNAQEIAAALRARAGGEEAKEVVR